MSERREGLTFTGIRKAYGAHSVLRGFSGTFLDGRLGALVGPNGAGKTTLLRIAAGLQYADDGAVQGREILYYGGFDTLPVQGTINGLRTALGLAETEDGGRRLKKLSRGQLHSVGLAIALELERHTILLDEPWTSLEPDAREALNARLAALKAKGHVIVCSTHDLDEVARIADDVVFLRDGDGVWHRREDEPDGQFDRELILQRYRGRR